MRSGAVVGARFISARCTAERRYTVVYQIKTPEVSRARKSMPTCLRYSCGTANGKIIK